MKKNTKKVIKKSKPAPKKSQQKKSVKKEASGIIPHGERVLVRPFTEAELQGKSVSGFILPESMQKEKSAQGKILAIGDTKNLKVGDRVIFSKYSYDEVEHEGETLYLLKEENILAVIK